MVDREGACVTGALPFPSVQNPLSAGHRLSCDQIHELFRPQPSNFDKFIIDGERIDLVELILHN